MKSRGRRGWRKAGHRGFSDGYRKSTLWASIAQHYVKIYPFMSLKYSFMRYLYWHLYPKKRSNWTISAHKESSAGLHAMPHMLMYNDMPTHARKIFQCAWPLCVCIHDVFEHLFPSLLSLKYLGNCVEQWATSYCCLPRTNALNTSLCIIHHSRLTFWTPPHGSK